MHNRLLPLLTALTPTVAVSLATLMQRQDVRDLRVKMKALRNGAQAEMVRLRNQVHADLLIFDERVARVEAKQS